jgi:hypothetical protein
VEPFAGAAGYALRYRDRKVFLYDADPQVMTIWAMIVQNRKLDKRLPRDLPVGADARELTRDEDVLCLLRYSAGVASIKGQWKVSAWGSKAWPLTRRRIVEEAPTVSHWRGECLSFERAPNRAATWYVDPPYSVCGVGNYTHSVVDYSAIADCVLNKWRGQRIVCEEDGANWLPFEKLVARRNSRNGVKWESMFHIKD